MTWPKAACGPVSIELLPVKNKKQKPHGQDNLTWLMPKLDNAHLLTGITNGTSPETRALDTGYNL